MNIHDMSKVIRRGYSKVIDQLSREIRFQRINKRYAENACKYYSRIPKKSIERFFNFLDIEKASTNWIKKFFFNYKIQKNSFYLKNNYNIKDNLGNNPKKFFLSYGKGLFL